MTLVRVPQGFLWPRNACGMLNLLGDTIALATEKIAHIGRLYIDGRPGTPKTISAAGGGSISFRTGVVTFADGGTTLDIGIQDVSTTGGPNARPDGTFDVKRTLTGGGGGVTGSAWNTVSMTGGTGSKSISHGDLIAVVWDLTARAGTDSVIVQASSSQIGQIASAFNFPVANNFSGGSWNAASVVKTPNVVITFDDGTLACIDGFPGITPISTETWGDATDPDERGMLVEIPWDCEIDAYWAVMQCNSVETGDFDIALYSDPLGTPAVVDGPHSWLAEWSNLATVNRLSLFPRSGPISLSAGLYGVTFKATSTGFVGLRTLPINNAAYRVLWPYGANANKITRNNSTGAFTAGLGTLLYEMGVRICSIHQSSGGAAGGGLLVHPGMEGGFL